MSTSHPTGRRLRAAVAFAVVMVSASLALAQPAPPAPAQPGPSASGDLPTGLSADLFYQLLLADIALQRGDPALAARAYLEVARELKDVRLARRAAEIAYATRQRATAEAREGFAAFFDKRPPAWMA